MPHPTHRLKAYTADANRPHVFCFLCGKEEDEGLDNPCLQTFYQKDVDTTIQAKYPKFVTGLPFND
jgi:hypothetical protein